MTRREKVKAVHRAQREEKRKRRLLEGNGLTNQSRVGVMMNGNLSMSSIGAIAAATMASQKKG